LGEHDAGRAPDARLQDLADQDVEKVLPRITPALRRRSTKTSAGEKQAVELPVNAKKPEKESKMKLLRMGAAAREKPGTG